MRRKKERKPPREATTAKPGTPEKIAVLRSRFKDGESLYHPDDETIPIAPSHYRHRQPGPPLPNGVQRRYNRFRAKPWCPRLGRQILLGSFNTVEEAVEAIRVYLEQ